MLSSATPNLRSSRDWDSVGLLHGPLEASLLEFTW